MGIMSSITTTLILAPIWIALVSMMIIYLFYKISQLENKLQKMKGGKKK